MATKIIRGPKFVVFNLPWTVGARELREYFSKFGPVAYADVKFDRATGFSRHFGFIEFSRVDTAQKIFEEPQHVIEGNIVTIKRTEDN